MHLDSIKIKNFRSIREIEIPLKEIGGKRAAILIGLNESGKSNILKAANFLEPDLNIEYSLDANKDLKKKNEPIEVYYRFMIENDDFLKDRLLRDGFGEKIIENVSFKQINRYVRFDKNSLREDYFHIYSEVEDSYLSKYVIDESMKSLIFGKDAYSGLRDLSEDNIGEVLGENFKIATRKKFENIIEEKYLGFVDSYLPKIVFWRSADEKYLIKNPIDLNAFKKDPSISQPLKNIFHIAEIIDIEGSISNIANDPEEKYELEAHLSNSITAYINRVWREHEINIKVRIEGMECQVSVEDKDNTRAKYKMGQRSDGFKQFISILLNLSAENESNQLNNALIVLDEPEVHLHPSGVKYLREELLKIAENNQVIIATHSIYMVDRLNLDRHFQVRKSKSISEIFQIEPDNPYQEEVVYEALGTSVFEHISPNMLVLEGKTDKDIFDAFTQKFKTELKPLKLGTISADGVDNIPKYVKFFDGKLVKGFVLVDSDADGLKVLNQIIRDNDQYSKKNVMDINSLNRIFDGCTLEDMFPTALISKCVEAVYEISIDLDDNKPCMAQIKQKLRDRQIFDKKDNLKKLKSEIAQQILVNLNKKSSTKSRVKETYPIYYNFLVKIHQKLKKK